MGLQRPYWHPYEKETLVNVVRTTAWQKLRLTSHAEIFHLSLVNDVSDDFRRGFLECFAFLDDTVKEFATEEAKKAIAEQEEQMISMQGEDEDL